MGSVKHVTQWQHTLHKWLMVPLHQTKGLPELNIRNALNDIKSCETSHKEVSWVL